MGQIIAWAGGLITAIGVLLGGVATVLSGKGAGAKTAVETMQMVLTELRTDLTDTRARLAQLENDTQVHRAHMARQDKAIHRLQGELRRALDHIRDVWAWVDQGAHPPPPTRPDWLTGLTDRTDRDTDNY